MNAKETQP